MGLAFMKKDIDVNDCEFLPPSILPKNWDMHWTFKMAETSSLNNLLRFIFLMKEENDGKKERVFCWSL